MTVLKKYIFHFILLVVHTAECYSEDNKSFFKQLGKPGHTFTYKVSFPVRHDSNKS